MFSPYPLRSLMETARDLLQRQGRDASLTDAAEALGRGRRRVAREMDVQNVKTDTLREALAHWRRAGHPELEVRITADGFAVLPRESAPPRLRIDLIQGEPFAPSPVLDPERGQAGAALFALHHATGTLRQIRIDTAAETALLVRIAWSGPLLRPHLAADVVAQDGGAPVRSGPCGPIVDLEDLHGPDLAPERVTALRLGLALPVAGLRLHEDRRAVWWLFCAGYDRAPGVWPRIRVAGPSLAKLVRALETTLH